MVENKGVDIELCRWNKKKSRMVLLISNKVNLKLNALKY